MVHPQPTNGRQMVQPPKPAFLAAVHHAVTNYRPIAPSSKKPMQFHQHYPPTTTTLQTSQKQQPNQVPPQGCPFHHVFSMGQPMVNVGTFPKPKNGQKAVKNLAPKPMPPVLTTHMPFVPPVQNLKPGVCPFGHSSVTSVDLQPSTNTMAQPTILPKPVTTQPINYPQMMNISPPTQQETSSKRVKTTAPSLNVTIPSPPSSLGGSPTSVISPPQTSTAVPSTFDNHEFRLAPIVAPIEGSKNKDFTTDPHEDIPDRSTKIALLRKWLESSEIKPSPKYEDGKGYIIHKLMTDDDVNYQFWTLLDSFVDYCNDKLRNGLPIHDVTQTKVHKEGIEQLESLYTSIGVVSKCPFLILRKEEGSNQSTERLPSISRLALPGLTSTFNYAISSSSGEPSGCPHHQGVQQVQLNTKCPVGYHSISNELEDMGRASGAIPPRQPFNHANTVTEDGQFSEASESYIKAILDLCGIPITLYSLDFGGRILLWNRKARQLLGCESVSDSLKWDDLLHPSSEHKAYLPETKSIPATCMSYRCNFTVSNGTTQKSIRINSDTTTFLSQRYSVLSFRQM